MSIKIEIAPYLRPFIGNTDTVQVNEATVRDCLNTLIAKFPDIQHWIFDNHGTLKIIVVKNQEVVTPKDLDSTIDDNDHIRIIMPLEGG